MKGTIIKYFTILLIFIIKFVSAEDKLISVLILFRHGKRAPIHDDYYPEDWKNTKKGHLTREGFDEIVRLGKKIRK